MSSEDCASLEGYWAEAGEEYISKLQRGYNIRKNLVASTGSNVYILKMHKIVFYCGKEGKLNCLEGGKGICFHFSALRATNAS
jgi:hypothetical protein